jgi:hypothetical protein
VRSIRDVLLFRFVDPEDGEKIEKIRAAIPKSVNCRCASEASRKSILARRLFYLIL